MGERVEFKKEVTVWGDGSRDVYVEEIGFGRILHSASEASADAYIAHATHEHSAGRVAHGRCGKGELCDRDRINDMRLFATIPNPREVVLCSAHEEERRLAAVS